MITRVEIENFRCLKSVQAPLKPLTVLIGPNNTGKTAFLSALHLPRFAGQKALPTDSWQETDAPRVLYYLPYDSDLYEVTRNGDAWDIPKAIRQNNRPIGFYGQHGLHPAMQSNGVPDRSGIPSIDDAAAVLPAYLDSLLRLERRTFLDLVDRLGELLPGFADLQIATPDAQQRRIDIEWKSGYRMQGHHASYGVKLLVFFVALAYHPTPPKLVLIDEPETGVHPKLLQEIVELLRGLTLGKFANEPVQVVMSTHSPYLLDYIDPTEDQVLIATHGQEGAREIHPVDEERIKPFLDEFMLGEVWLNRGEEGLLSK